MSENGHNVCLNCGSRLTGNFCAHCGQAADVHAPTTQHLLHEVLEGLTHSDSRLWRTLRQLAFKPGALTREFVDGRRVAYLPPFRLYLIASVIFFVVASMTQMHVKVIELDGHKNGADSEAHCREVNFGSMLGQPQWDASVQRACVLAERDQGAGLTHAFFATMPKAMFFFLPLLAFFSTLLYWRPRHNYAEHLVFFLHLHAFFFALLSAQMLTDAALAYARCGGPLSDVLGLITFWILIAYTVLAMRRYFGRTWPVTVLQVGVLLVVYLVMMLATFSGVFIYAALRQ